MTISEFVNKVGFKVNEQDVQKVNDSIAGIKDTATKLLGAIGIGFSLAAINGLSEEFGRVNNQIQNATSALGKQEKIQQQILASASKTRTSYSQTATIISNLVQENKELFGSVEEAAKFNNAATMLFKAAGKTNEEIAGLMEAINKSFAKGYVDSETMSQMLERSPEAVQLLNERLGTTSSQLEEMASSGAMSVADLKAAFVDNYDIIEKKFGNVQYTITDGLTYIRNQWGLWIAQTDKTLNLSHSIGKVMVSAFNGVISVLNKVRTGVVWLSEKLGGAQNLLKTIGIIGGSILAVMKAQKILDFVKNLGKGLGAIKAQTVLIIAVVALIALLIDDFINFLQGNESLLGHFFDKMGINADEVRQKIKTVFSNLRQFLVNLWNGISKVLSAIWGGIKKAATSIWGGITSYFEKHGSGTKKSLTSSWNSIKNSLTEIWNSIKSAVEGAFGKINSMLEKHGTSIEGIFTKIGEAIGFVIDVVVRLTGKIAAIGFDILSGAVKICTDMFTGLVDIVCSAVDFFAEHKVLTDVLAAAIGVLTTAIIAYNVAQAIKNAGGIAEIAQLAATAIGVGALTVAETAHTVATTIATAATTAFGAAMAFLTSPITLVVAAIAAVIAIIVLCIKHWDKIKEAAAKCWDWIKGIWEKVATWFKSTVIDPIVGFFTGLWDGIVGIFQGIIDWVKQNWESIVLFIINPFAGVFNYLYENFEGFRNFVNNIVQSVVGFFTGLWNSIVNGAKTAWNGITGVFSKIGAFFKGVWDSIVSIFTKVGTAVSDAVTGAVRKAINGVLSGAIGIINGFISAINAAIGLINKIPGVNIKKLSKLEVPKLAQGGYVDRDKPQLAIIGDNKQEGEIVSPVSKITDAVASALKMFAPLARLDRVSPQTAGVVQGGNSVSKTIVQNIEFNNEFNGERAIQEKASRTMDKSADDITAQLARGLALAT